MPTRWHRNASPSIRFIPSASTTNEPITIAVAMPQNAMPPMTPSCVALKSNDRPQAGKTSCRITNEKAEATREIQLATNNRRGFMHSVSGAIKFATARRESCRIKKRTLFFDNRAGRRLPGGTRSNSHCFIDRPMPSGHSRRPMAGTYACASRLLRYAWAAPTTLVGLIAGLSRFARAGRCSGAAARSSFMAAFRDGSPIGSVSGR